MPRTLARAAGAFLIGALMFISPARADTRIYIGVQPPPPIVEVRPAPPHRTYVWRAGHYTWNGHRYVWVRGRWVRPPYARARWATGRWAHEHRGWYWVPGHWARR